MWLVMCDKWINSSRYANSWAHRSWDWIGSIKHKAQKPLRKTAKMCFLQPPLKQRREGPIIKVEITDVKADRSLSIVE